MPETTPFAALGRGNGFPFCCIPIDIINNPPDPSNDPYELWELCPETFTLEEVVNWFWNGHDYTSTAITYGRYLVSNNELLNEYTWYLSYSDANEAFSGSGDLNDFGQGLAFRSLGSARNIEPHKRVCTDGARLVFTELNDSNASYNSILIYVMISYDESNNNYRFLVRSPYSTMGTEKYVESVFGVGETTTFSLPITPSKNISIPMAVMSSTGSTEYRFVDTTTGELDFYTYP